MFFQQYFWLKADALHLALVYSKASQDAAFYMKTIQTPSILMSENGQVFFRRFKAFFFLVLSVQSFRRVPTSSAPQFLTSNPSPTLIPQRSSWKPRPVHSSSFRKKFNLHLAVLSKALSSVHRAPLCKMPFLFQPRCTPWLSETLTQALVSAVSAVWNATAPILAS